MLSFTGIRRFPTSPREKRPRAVRPCVEGLENRVALSLGSEFAVAATSQSEFASVSAGSPNGMSVVVWQQNVGDKYPLVFQRYNASGNRVGGPTYVDGLTSTDGRPAVAMDGSGNFVVTWNRRYNTSTGYDLNVLAARFNSSGQRLGGNVWVATDPSKKEYEPSVACDLNGNFVVSYTVDYTPSDKDVMAKMFTSQGTSTRLIIVAGSLKNEWQSSVARGPLGRFSIGYTIDYNGTDRDVSLKRYTATGNLESSFTIAAGATEERDPTVSMDNYGNAVIAWSAMVDGDHDIFARRVSSGLVMGSRITIRNNAEDERLPHVALNRTNGSFVVAFQLDGVTGARIGVDEVSASDSVRTRNTTSTERSAPMVSVSGTSRYLVTYTHNLEDIYGRWGTIV
jgi:hypothetical protein